MKVFFISAFIRDSFKRAGSILKVFY